MTYPLDTLRLRLAVDPAARSLRGAALALLREGSYAAFFRGLGASMLGDGTDAAGCACIGGAAACVPSRTVLLTRGSRSCWQHCMCNSHGHRVAQGCAAVAGASDALYCLQVTQEYAVCMCAPCDKHCTCAGIAPYMAIELAVFDLIPRRHLPFARGFTAAFLATTACYPLDTVRCTQFLSHKAQLLYALPHRPWQCKDWRGSRLGRV